MANQEDQLKLTMQIAAATDRVARTLEKIEGSYQTQVGTVQKLATVISQMNVDKATDAVAKLHDTVDKLVKGLDKVGDLSEKNLDDLGREAQKTNNTMRSLGASVNETGKQMTTATDASAASVQSIQEKLEGAVSEMDLMQESSSATAASWGKVAKRGTMLGAVVSGLHQGFQNVIGLSRGLFSFFAGIASGAANITASIISIPLKIFTGIVDFAAKAPTGISDFLTQIKELMKQFGALGGPGAHAVLQVTRHLKGFSATGLSAWRIFGTIAERMQEVREVATAMGPAFNTQREDFKKNGGAILAYRKALGIATEDMGAMANRATTMGKPMSSMFLEMSKQSLGLGKAFNIDQKLIARDMSKAMTDVAHFGQSTVAQIGRATVYSRKLGVELSKITGILDAFETFDSAAENAAKLSQSFGVTVDAFKMMEAQNPDEQIEMLRKQFKLANVDTSTFNRQQLKLLSSTTGLDAATAKQVFSLKNQGVSLDEIKKKSKDAKNQQLTQAQAMSKLADSIERLVKTAPQLKGNFFDMFVKGFFRGMQSSREFRRTIYNIKYALVATMMEGVKLGRIFVKIFPGVKEFFGGLRDFFAPSHFRTFFGGITKEFKAFFQRVQTGNYSVDELMKGLRKRFFDFFDMSKPSGIKIIEGFKSFMAAFVGIISALIPKIAHELGKGFGMIGDFLNNPSSMLAKMKSKATSGGGFLMTLLAPIIHSLYTVWKDPTLRNGLHKFVFGIGYQLKKIVKSSIFKKVAIGVAGSLAAVLLGPTVLHAILGGMLTTIGGSAMRMIGGLFTKKAGAGLLKKAGGKGIGKLAGAAGPIGAIIAAGVAVGGGVNKYTSKITSTLDHSSKVLGAGATGILDAITLGLLPDNLTIKFANIFAKLADAIFDSMGKIFGHGFANSIKRKLTSSFEVLGSIYGFFAAMFGNGDQASFDAAAKDLGLSLLRLVVNSFEFFQVQLPMFVGRIIVKVLSLIGKMTVKSVAFSLGLLAKGVDSALGTHLSERVNKLSNVTNAIINKGSKKITASMLDASNKIDAQTGKFVNKHLRAAEVQAHAASAAAKKIQTSKKSSAKAHNKKLENTLDTTLEKIRSAKQIRKELKTSGGTFKALMSDIRKQLKGADFNVLSKTQVESLKKSGESVDSASDVISNVTNMLSNIGNIPHVIKGATNALKAGGTAPAIKAVKSMIKLANELDSTLSEGNLNKLDVQAKLKRVAENVGMGAKGNYTIKNKNVNVTVNLEVNINAEDLEKALIMRTKSKIRQRLNWMAQNPTQQGGPDIPGKTSGDLQDIRKI